MKPDQEWIKGLIAHLKDQNPYQDEKGVGYLGKSIWQDCIHEVERYCQL